MRQARRPLARLIWLALDMVLHVGRNTRTCTRIWFCNKGQVKRAGQVTNNRLGYQFFEFEKGLLTS